METLNDASDFKRVQKALSVIEFSAEEQDALFAIIASVIHLGTVGFLEPEIEHGEVKLENGRPVNVISKVKVAMMHHLYFVKSLHVMNANFNSLLK